MSTPILSDPPVVYDAGMTFRSAGKLLDLAMEDLIVALRTLQESSPYITIHVGEGGLPDAGNLGRLVAANLARIGTGLQAVSARMHAIDIPLTDDRYEATDEGLGGFALGAADFASSRRLRDLGAASAGPRFGDIENGSEREVDTVYGRAVQRGSDGSWFLCGPDGRWYLVDQPTTDAARYGYQTVGVSEGVVELRGKRDWRDRLAQFVTFGAGIQPGSPSDYGKLDWNGDGTDPYVGDEVNVAMSSDVDDHPGLHLPAGSDIDDRPYKTPGQANSSAAVVGFSMLLGGGGAAANEDGRYQGARVTYTEDANGNRRAVIQGASISTAGVQPYNVVGFSDDGNPIGGEARTVPFEMSEAAGCRDDGSRNEGDIYSSGDTN